MANLLTQSRKEKLDYLIKLDKAETECRWDYEKACEYRATKTITRCDKILRAIEKKCNQVWLQLAKSFKVDDPYYIPNEIKDYYHNGRANNKYDRWANYERDLIQLGVKIPK
jgi:hypothetical protein